MPEPGPHPGNDLIYDVGMHRGEDTAYYLAKGYRVVAFEANPELARAGRARFADAIASGALTILEGAIAEQGKSEVTFYIDDDPQWGSIDPAWVRKKGVRRPQRPISVATVDLAACMRRYGVPHYMKIDIEGADRLCLEALRTSHGLPDFLSTEVELLDLEALEADLNLLDRLGYSRFATVKQGGHRKISTRTLSGHRFTYSFPSRSSGPFGEDLDATWIPKTAALRRHRWLFRRQRIEQRLRRNKLAFKLLYPVWERSATFRRLFFGYYDIHARLR